jgi:prolycopene isomerase
LLVGAALALGSSAPGTGCGGSEGVDAVTSATPGVAEALLGESHAGHRKADCLGCHARNHGADHRPPDCANCHGANGAGLRPVGHAPEGCASCHRTTHAGLGLNAPGDCLACHGFATSGGCGSLESFDVVVVGAGGGGLAAAAALARAGLRVVVLEKSFKPGGCMTNFRRGDFRFEASLHGFDGLDPEGFNQPLFERLGISARVRPVRIAPMYRSVLPGGLAWDIPAEFEVYRAMLKAEFPAEATGIDGLLDEFLEIGDIIQAIAKAPVDENGIPVGVPFEDLLKLQAMNSLTLGELLEKHVHDLTLIAVVTQLAGFAGAAPSRVCATFFIVMWHSYHVNGYYYFEGGSQAVSDALAEVIVENGGQVRFHQLVTRIGLDGGLASRVETASGACYQARYVVSNAPAPATLLEMVGAEHLPAEYAQRVRDMRVGLSALVVYLGLDTPLAEPFGPTHEVMIAQELDPEESFQAIERCQLDRVGLSLTNYTLVDPGAAPAGKGVLTITSQLGYDCLQRYGADVSRAEVARVKADIAERLLEKAEAFLPGLRRRIEVMEVATPITIQGYTLNPRGSIFGWDNTVDQSMLNRLAQKTPIPNLFLAGAWTFPGGGQSAVMTSGAQVADMILRAEGLLP